MARTGSREVLHPSPDEEAAKQHDVEEKGGKSTTSTCKDANYERPIRRTAAVRERYAQDMERRMMLVKGYSKEFVRS